MKTEKLTKVCDEIRNRANRAGWTVDRIGLVELYTFGLEIKLDQSDYAMTRAKEYCGGGRSKDEARPRLEFYCDQWWCVVWSALDILGNLVNVCESLGMTEDDVYLSAVETELQNQKPAGDLVTNRVRSLRSTPEFAELRRYRRCATHRRHVCIISTDIQLGQGYGGSVATAPITETAWYLCDDPLSLQATHTEQKRIPDHMIATRDRLFRDIKGVLTALRRNI